MSGDDVDAALERQGQDARVRILRADNRQRVLASGVGQQRQFGFRHAFPETREAAVVAIDVLAVGQAFHHRRARCQASFKLFNSVWSCGMDRDGRQKLRMLLCQIQYVIIRHIKRARVFERAPLFVMHQILGQNDRCAD